jgi:hypothetical protein
VRVGEPTGTVVARSGHQWPPPGDVPPSSQGWRERTGCWCGEDTGEAEERRLSRFSVASGTVEARVQACGAGHKPVYLQLRRLWRSVVWPALDCYRTWMVRWLCVLRTGRHWSWATIKKTEAL